MYRLEPWGDDWEQAAMIAADIRNANRAEESEPTEPQTLIPNEDTRLRIKAQIEGQNLADSMKERAERRRR